LSASTPDASGDTGQLRARVTFAAAGEASVETGIQVLDHLLTLMARYARIDLALEVEPGAPSAEASAAGAAVGDAVRPHLRAEVARGHGSASIPAGEALAHVVLEASDEALFASNVDLAEAHAGGLAADVIGDFLRSFSAAAGLTLHVRLLEGDDPGHVLEAIFKALGAAVAQACAA
jgi:imidazoleglycerol-phosphate dehydratase